VKTQQPYDCFVSTAALRGRGRTRTTSLHRRAKRSDLSASCYEEAKRSDLSQWLMEASCKQAAPETNLYFYHPDHLGSSSFITDATGYAVQHLQPACRSFGAGRYLPFGEPKRLLALSSRTPLKIISECEQTFVDQTPATNPYDSRYTFSAKEKDDETSYSYFGARYYDSDLSVWLSVDPMSDERSWISPYNYCQWNPVGRVDPSGALDWKPIVSGGKIYLQAEKGDNYQSLITFFSSRGNAERYISGSVLNQMQSGRSFSQIPFNETNVFSQAMAQGEKRSSDYSYNCHESMKLALGISITNQPQKGANEDVKAEVRNSMLSSYFEEASASEAVFGKTVMTYGDAHTSIFFGKSQDGTVYTFSKNGGLNPVICPVNDIVNGYDGFNGFGPVGKPNGESFKGYRPDPYKKMTFSVDNFGRSLGAGGSGIKRSNGTGLYNYKYDIFP